MKKIWLEIGISTGLVFLMVALILIAEIVLPVGLKSSSFALIVLVFMAAMGFAGIKLVDM